MSKFQITTADGLVFEVDSAQIDALDINKNKDGSFHLIHEGRSYNIEVLESDYLNKSYVLNINEKEISLSLKNELDMAIEKMGFSEKSALSGGKVESPMPGMVLNVAVKEGNPVKKGDLLVILEAMKMENIIKSPADGMVKSIHVQQGDTVAKKQLLVELD